MMEEEDCINKEQARKHLLSKSAGVAGEESTERVSPSEASITSLPDAARDAIKSI